MLEEQLGIVAGGLGFGQGGGQCRPGGVVEDLLSVFGHDHEDPLGVPFHGAGRWLALGQGGQRLGSSLLVDGLQVDQGLVGGGDLLVVLAGLVPAGCGEDDEHGDVEEHRQPGPVTGDRHGAQRADGAPEGVCLVLLGADAGAGGAFERCGGLLQLWPHVAGGEQRQDIDGFAKGCDVGLGCRVVTVVEVVGNALGRGGGLVPGVGPAPAARLRCGRSLDGGEAFADLGEDRSGASLAPENQIGSPAALVSPATAALYPRTSPEGKC